MKAAIINKTGGPEVIELKDIILEKPSEDEVTIEQKAIGLNYIDTYHRSGLYPLKLPIGLGLEGAGIITDVGSNVKNFKAGEKVAYAAIPLGSYSTHRNFPASKLVKIPDGVDLEIAATLMTKGLTTYYLLHQTYKVKSGDTILFHAAAGGVGQIFGQWAKSLGCNVIGTVGSEEKIEVAKKCGYDHVINYSKDDFPAKVKELTDGKGVPVVYDGVGKNTLEALRSGFYWGYSGLINNILLKIEKETKKKYKVIFTGGYADLFKTSINRPFKVDKDITIKGIIEIFKENKKQLK